MIVDHCSRRVIGFAAFPKRPNSLAVRTFIGKTAAGVNATPKYLICDKDSIFWCVAFKRWCKKKAIRPRYGAIGKHGSIALVERLIRTIKDEATRRIVVPQRQAGFRRELTSYLAWYNQHRPHATANGKTPNEVYFRADVGPGLRLAPGLAHSLLDSQAIALSSEWASTTEDDTFRSYR